MLSLRDRTLHVIFGVTLMGVIGVSIISPALPKIRDEFGVTDAEVALLVTAFTLPGIFFAPAIGILADRFGRKKILIPCLFLFAIAGVGCAFVDLKTMLVLRFLQGIGGSALTALSATLIGDIYTGMDRAKALGYNASVLAIGTASYPFIGGTLAYFDWRLPFFTFVLAIPVGIGSMLIQYPDIRPTNSLKEYMKNSVAILKNAKLLFEFISGAAVFVIFYGAFLTYLPFLLDKKFLADSITIGAILSSMSIFTAIIASRFEFFIMRLGVIGTIKLGFLCYTISMLIVPFIPSLYLFILVTLLFGLGQGTVLPALQDLIVSTAPKENRGIVMTTYSSAIRVGQTAGPLIASLSALYTINAVFLVSALIALAFVLMYHFFKIRTLSRK